MLTKRVQTCHHGAYYLSTTPGNLASELLLMILFVDQDLMIPYPALHVQQPCTFHSHGLWEIKPSLLGNKMGLGLPVFFVSSTLSDWLFWETAEQEFLLLAEISRGLGPQPGHHRSKEWAGKKKKSPSWWQNCLLAWGNFSIQVIKYSSSIGSSSEKQFIPL